MGHFLQAFYGVLGLTLLYYGAEFLVRGGSAIARRCGVPPLVVGLTLVAFGTSAPEFAVSLDAALNGMGDMSVGNVVGSNICNIALILGLCAWISPLPVNQKLFRFDVPVMVISAAALTGMCLLSGGVDRWEAALLFAGIVFYTVYSVRKSRGKAGGEDISVNFAPERGAPEWGIAAALLFSLLGLGALIGGGKLLLGSAVHFAAACGIPEAVIALTVVAAGTSLPELAASVVATIRGENDIAIGNVVGSNIFNILGILGFSALIAPIRAPGISRADLGVMLFFTLLLYPVMRSGRRIGRMEGAAMLLLYVAYTAYLVRR